MKNDMETEKKYWFGILPHVYYVRKGEKTLLYNTVDGSHIITSVPEVTGIVEEMHQKMNLGIAALTASQLENTALAQFVRKSCEKNICKIQEQVPDSPKPVQLMPVLNLQRDVDKLKEAPGRSVGEGIMDYLTEVTVVLNGECGRRCLECGDYGRQFFHCFKCEDGQELASDAMIEFLETVRYAPLRRLAFTGGDIFLYSQWDKLRPYLNDNGICPILGVHYQNITEAGLNHVKDCPLEIFVPSPIDKSMLSNAMALIGQRKANYIFSVTSDEDCAAAEEIIESLRITDFEFNPFFNNGNSDFFEKRVFTSQEDILDAPISQRVIFARQKMNTNFFGHILLLPNGDVKATLNGSILGNIQHGHIAEMVEREFVGTESWRKIRNGTICSECLFQFLCPSPSNYEIVMERENLCNK